MWAISRKHTLILEERGVSVGAFHWDYQEGWQRFSNVFAQSIMALWGKTSLCLSPYLTRSVVSASRLHFLPKPLIPHMMKMHVRETTASIKRYIRGHYTANPRTFRNLLVWITAFVDHFIASFVNPPIPSYSPLLWFPLDLNHLNLGMVLLIFHFNSRLFVLPQLVSVKHIF